MPDADTSFPTTPGLVLFAAMAVVGGLATLALAAVAVLGGVGLPPALRGPGIETLLVSTVLLAAFGIFGYRGYRRSLVAKAAGESRDPYWVFRPVRVVAAIGAGVVVVAIVANVTKVVVEGATSLTYEIHYLETVPLLSLGAAWFVNGEWNRRVGVRGEETDQGDA